MLNQLTSLTATAPSTIESLTYNYPTGANNGKLSSMYNAVSGETITYTYDSLNRLLTANGSGWGESYGFDPFGNLLSKTVTSGSGPSLSQSVNPANNQIDGGSYDANGNTTLGIGQYSALGYDAENRLAYATPNYSEFIYYAYDGQNRRIWSWAGAEDSFDDPTNYTVNVYTPGGQKLGAYTFSVLLLGEEDVPTMQVALATSDQYFGGRRLGVMDQLGSAGSSAPNAGSYFPWGEPRSGTGQDTWNFATYWADSATGLDYANNRYYSNAYGRFMTPDPYGGSAKSNNPQSWNRYAYVIGDPVNKNDVTGLGDDDDGPDPDDDDDDDDDGGSGNPCVAEDGFTPSPSPYCQSDGPPPPAPAPAQPAPTPQCDVKEQFAPVPGTFHAGVHTYLDVEIDGAWSVLEATFSGSNPFSKNAQMDALVTAGLGGRLKIDHPATDTTVWDAQRDAPQLTAQQLCNDAQAIMNAATAFQQNHTPGSAGAVPYNLWGNNGIPNSNSFVRYLLTFAPDFGTVPHSKRARGWSNLILGR